MKKYFLVLLVLAMVLSVSACGGDSGSGGGGGKSKKMVMFEIRNESGAPMVIDISTDISSFEDLDALDAEDFTVGTGVISSVSEDVDNFASYGWSITETSPSTYEITRYIAAGPVPEGEEYLYLGESWRQLYPDATGKVYTVTIKGKYNELAVVEWDGSGFTQTQ